MICRCEAQYLQDYLFPAFFSYHLLSASKLKLFAVQGSLWRRWKKLDLLFKNWKFKMYAFLARPPMSGTLTQRLPWTDLTTMATRALAWWSSSSRRGRSNSSWRTLTTTSSSSLIAPRQDMPASQWYKFGFNIYIFQAETASEGQSEHLVDLPQVSQNWYSLLLNWLPFKWTWMVKVRTLDLWNLVS